MENERFRISESRCKLWRSEAKENDRLIIIIMEICKAPTLRLKALNKYGITYIMYIEMEMLSAIKMYIRKGKRKKS